MQAAVLCEVNQPRTLETVTLDAPLPHEVWIRTAANGVCHSDLHAVHGNTHPPPAVLGHDPSGIL
jgi:S-(hydroxymethyl)glutathione dehydrogenase/alcohol dehydrogenase